VDLLRSGLSEWFNFYNGYDPLFTWWMGLPYKQADAALQAYAALLRDKVAVADLAASDMPVPAPAAIVPAPAPRFGSVPDLQEILSLPQDEMSAIVQRFRGAGGGRGGRGGDTPPGESVTRDRKFYEDWLAALQTLDFDTLSRNAQVDYLYIRKAAEQQLARVGVTLPANPPRKTDQTGIPGAARGRQGLIFDLQDEFIPYTPEELIALAEKEFAWCEVEMKRASRQMGFGDVWKKALERVKEIHPPPGGQVRVVRDLMFQAVDYLRARDLLTVPAVAAESLRMNMMTPERQLVNPFFTGGALISVSYPTDTMDYDARIQSMRGNNTPFSHATAFHEMIPGHNLVFYINARYIGYRANLGSTSFYGEGGRSTGSAAVRPRLPCDAGGKGGRAVLAHAPVGPHHLLAPVPHGRVVAAGVRGLPGGPGGLRARKRDRRGAALVPGELRAALPGGVPAGRPPAARAAAGDRGHQTDGPEVVSRRDPAAGEHAHRVPPPHADEAEVDARHAGRLEVLRADARPVITGPHHHELRDGTD
jgi:hypothetical protein